MLGNEQSSSKSQLDKEYGKEWDKNSALSGNDSDESNNNEEFAELHKFMSPPNPLDERSNVQKVEVKTAFKLNFTKLPYFDGCTTSRLKEFQKSPQEFGNEDITTAETSKAYESKLPEQTYLEDTGSMKSLFTLYPEGDPRLVYQKYKPNAVLNAENRLYAGYLVDLSKLGKGKNVLQTQYSEQDNNNGRNSYPKVTSDPTSLVFNSAFESGNLFAAFRIQENEYDLVLQTDINSKGNTQWFFFSAENTKKNAIVKFNIVNLLKPSSLFNDGMKPAVFSVKNSKEKGANWDHDGFNITYRKNNIMRECQYSYHSYYSLTFSYRFNYDDDVVYFAHCFPYTYSDLNNHLNKLASSSDCKKYITRKVLCKTLAKNDCEFLTITSNKNLENLESRLGIFVSARQHPGESLSSFMMQGVIDFLCSEEEEAKFLRDRCVVKIIPMMNPDGVIHGNYRTNLAGSDLNRRWKKTSKTLYPTVFAAKALLKDFSRNRDLQIICDLHGHSRKKSSFFYGCTDEKDPTASRILPLVLSKLTDMFSFPDSRFSIHKSKESTARVSLWKEYKIPNVFTLEASFFGYDSPKGTVHFSQNDFKNIGRYLCKAIYVYISQIKLGLTDRVMEISPVFVNEHKDKTNDEVAKITERPTISMKLTAENLLSELKTNTQLIEYGKMSDGDSGSDSNPSEDDLPKEQLIKILPKPMRPKVIPKTETAKQMISITPFEIKKTETQSTGTGTATMSSTLMPKGSDSTESKKNLRSPTVLRPKLSIPVGKKVRNAPEVTKIDTQPIDKASQTEQVYFSILSQLDDDVTSDSATIYSEDFALLIKSNDFTVLSAKARKAGYSTRRSESTNSKGRYITPSKDFSRDASSCAETQRPPEKTEASSATIASDSNIYSRTLGVGRRHNFIIHGMKVDSDKSSQKTMTNDLQINNNESSVGPKSTNSSSNEPEELNFNENQKIKLTLRSVNDLRKLPEYIKAKEIAGFLDDPPNLRIEPHSTRPTTKGADSRISHTLNKSEIQRLNEQQGNYWMLSNTQSPSKDTKMIRSPSLKTKYMNEEVGVIVSNYTYPQNFKPKFAIQMKKPHKNRRSSSNIYGAISKNREQIENQFYKPTFSDLKLNGRYESVTSIFEDRGAIIRGSYTPDSYSHKHPELTSTTTNRGFMGSTFFENTRRPNTQEGARKVGIRDYSNNRLESPIGTKTPEIKSKMVDFKTIKQILEPRQSRSNSKFF